jgi:ankyrin repeat protein
MLTDSPQQATTSAAGTSTDDQATLKQQLVNAISEDNLPLTIELLASGADPCFKPPCYIAIDLLTKSPLVIAICNLKGRFSEIRLAIIERLIAYANNQKELRAAAEKATEHTQNPKVLDLVLQQLKKIEEVGPVDHMTFVEKLVRFVGRYIVNESPGLEIECLAAIKNYLGEVTFSYNCLLEILYLLPITHASDRSINDGYFVNRTMSLIPTAIDLYSEEAAEYRETLQQLMERYIAAMTYILDHSKDLRRDANLIIEFAELGCYYDISPSQYHTLPLTRNVERIVKLLSDEADILRSPQSVHFAAENNNARLLWILLHKGLRNDWQNAEGNTALHIAAKLANPLIIEILLAVNPFLALIRNHRHVTARVVLRHFSDEHHSKYGYSKSLDIQARCMAAFDQAEKQIAAICAQNQSSDPISLIHQYATVTDLSKSFFALRTVPTVMQTNNGPLAPQVAASQSDAGNIILDIHELNPAEAKQALVKAIGELNVSAVEQLLDAGVTTQNLSANTNELLLLMNTDLSQTKALKAYQYQVRLAQIHSLDPRSEQSIIQELQHRQLKIAQRLLQTEQAADDLTTAARLAITVAGNAPCAEILLASLAAKESPSSSNAGATPLHINSEFMKLLTTAAVTEHVGKRQPLTVSMIQVLNRFGAKFTLEHVLDSILEDYPLASALNRSSTPSPFKISEEFFLEQRAKRCMTRLQAFYQNGADPREVDLDGRSFLHYLAMGQTLFSWENYNIYQLIIDIAQAAGADVNLQDITGKTPIYYALARGDNDPRLQPLIQGLIAAGADLTRADIKGQTPLHGAVLFEGWRNAKFLLKINPALITIADNNSETAKDLLDKVRRRPSSWLNKQSTDALWEFFIKVEQTIAAASSVENVSVGVSH